MTALSQRVNDNQVLDEMMRLLDSAVYDTSEFEAQQYELSQRIAETVSLIRQLIDTCATAVHDPNDYDRRYRELENRRCQLEDEYRQVTDRIDDLKRRRSQAVEVRDFLASQLPLEYSDEAWSVLVECAVIGTDGSIDLRFKA